MEPKINLRARMLIPVIIFRGYVRSEAFQLTFRRGLFWVPLILNLAFLGVLVTIKLDLDGRGFLFAETRYRQGLQEGARTARMPNPSPQRMCTWKDFFQYPPERH